MHKYDIEALVRAHRGRARPVAFLHVLRQPKLDPDDHAFLLEHVNELGFADMLRWRSRCEPGFSGVVIRELARMAEADPVAFRHEVLDAPRLDLLEDEWRELADRLHNKIPDAIHAIVVERGGPRPERPPPEKLFSPVVVKGESLFLRDDDIAPEVTIGLEAARELAMAELLAARRTQRLDVDDAGFAELALERARTGEEDWTSLTPALELVLVEAVAERAKRTRNADERANLLVWLERAELPRATLFAISLSPLDGPMSMGLVAWIARHLSNRAAWEKHGLELCRVLLERGAYGEIAEVVTLVCGDPFRRDDADRMRGVLEVIQYSLGAALVREAREGIVRRDEPRAMGPLSALVCLDPPSRLSRAVRELKSLDAPSQEIADLIAVNERMIRYSDARGATLEGVIAACHALADASTR